MDTRGIELPVYHPDQDLPIHHLTGDRSQVPLYAFLFPLCRGSTAEAWVVQRRLARSQTHCALQTGWRTWLRPGAVDH